MERGRSVSRTPLRRRLSNRDRSPLPRRRPPVVAETTRAYPGAATQSSSARPPAAAEVPAKTPTPEPRPESKEERKARRAKIRAKNEAKRARRAAKQALRQGPTTEATERRELPALKRRPRKLPKGSVGTLPRSVPEAARAAPPTAQEQARLDSIRLMLRRRIGAFGMRARASTRPAAAGPRRAGPTAEAEHRCRAPPFDSSACGTPGDWNNQDLQTWSAVTRKQLQLPEGEPMTAKGVVQFLQDFLSTRPGSHGESLWAKFGAVEAQPDQWFRLEWLPFTVLPLSEGNWQRGWHGCKMEALYSILYQGGLRPSEDETKGDRFFAGRPGVYLHKDDLQRKAENYIHWVHMCGDGQFWAAKWEVLYNANESVKHGKKTDQVIQASSSVALRALWIAARTVHTLKKGSCVQQSWKPGIEANPAPGQPSEDPGSTDRPEVDQSSYQGSTAKSAPSRPGYSSQAFAGYMAASMMQSGRYMVCWMLFAAVVYKSQYCTAMIHLFFHQPCNTRLPRSYSMTTRWNTALGTMLRWHRELIRTVRGAIKFVLEVRCINDQWANKWCFTCWTGWALLMVLMCLFQKATLCKHCWTCRSTGAKVADRQRRHTHFNNTTSTGAEQSFLGPKSQSGQGPQHTGVGACWRPLSYVMMFMILATEARVVTGANTVTGAEAHRGLRSVLPVQHMNSEEVGSHPKNIWPGRHWIAKRAFRRARERARQHGTTWYRGRQHTVASLSAEANTPIPETAAKAKTGRSMRSHRASQESLRDGCRVMTFNIGGASSAAWQEMMRWLATHPNKTDVVCVQETHWKDTTQFESGDWYVMTSGANTSDKCAGVAILIHKRLGKPEAISHRTLLNGRVLHARIQGKRNCIDVLCCYQHVWRDGDSDEKNVQNRASVWRAMQRGISATPLRNTLIIGGDMNCGLRQQLPHAGPGVLPKDLPKDADESVHILQTFGLTALNTWNAPVRTTCYTGNAESQIDFLLSRTQYAKGKAKYSGPDPLCELGAWKTNRHAPVFGFVYATQPWQQQRAKRQSHAMDIPMLQTAIAKNTAEAKQLRQDICAGLEMTPESTDLQTEIENIEHILNTSAASIFPPRDKPDNRVCVQPKFRVAAKEMWQAYRTMRRWRINTGRSILQAWAASVKFAKLSRQLKKAAKTVKKEMAERVMQDMEAAAKSGDTRLVWEATKKLAPWKPRSRFCLRGEAGEMLGSQEQLEELLKFSRNKFGCWPDYVPNHILQETMAVSVQELEKAMGALPYRRAVPKGCAPSALWRLCSTTVAPRMAQALKVQWAAGTKGLVPASLKDTQLAWLAKPNKPSSRPDGLRPIGLLHPVGKVLCTILRTRLRPLLEQALISRPQYAYTTGRSTLDALLRAHGHIRKAQQLVTAQRKSIYDLHAGAKQHQCVGGITFSLDLEGAFDAVPRPYLVHSLRRLGVDEDLVQLLMGFHHGARYRMAVGVCEGSIESSCGIKQGCKVAPFLFVAFTIAIMDELQQRLTSEWLTEGFTFYADDALASWLITSPEVLTKSLAGIQTVIDVFNSYGMKLSAKKTVVLYNIQGNEAKKILKTKLVWKQQIKYMQYVQNGEDFLVQVKSAHEYLGTILAYRDSAMRSLEHRLQKARGQYAALRKTLHAKRIISKKLRFRIWQAGVWSSASYGLTATGIRPKGVARIRAMAARQVRAISGKPAHLTFVSNAEIRQMFDMTPVVEQLHQQAKKKLQELELLANTHPSDIRGHPLAVEQLRQVIAEFDVPPEDSQLHRVEMGALEQVACPECGTYFSSLKTMRQHRARVHGIKVTRDVTFDAARHAIGGLPQCRGCKHKFQSWTALQKHVEQSSCFMTKEPEEGLQQPDGEPPVNEDVSLRANPEVARIIMAESWEAVVSSQFAEQLKQHCCLCARWIKDPTALKRHLKQTHKSDWEYVADRFEIRCAAFKHRLIRDGTCPYCTRPSYSRHFKQCNIIFQSAILGLLHEQQHGLAAPDDDVLQPPPSQPECGAASRRSQHSAGPATECGQHAPTDAEPADPTTALEDAKTSRKGRREQGQSRRGEDQQDVGPPGDNCSPPRGCPSLIATGQGLLSTHDSVGARRVAHPFVEGQPGMASATRTRSDFGPGIATHGDAPGHCLRAGRKNSEASNQRGVTQAGPKSGMAEGGTRLRVPEVGPGEGGPPGQRANPTAVDRRSPAVDHGDTAHAATPLHHQVLRGQIDEEGATTGGSGHLSAGSVAQRGGSRQACIEI